MSSMKQGERLERAAEEVLAILDRWDSRLQGHHTQKRQYVRKPYRTKMTVFIPQSDGMAGESMESTSFPVWSRNISQGGVSFIYPGQLKHGKYLMCLDPEKSGSLWFVVEIVRSREVHNEFWEYGAKMLERASL
ncbi:MAG: PilZ domain-containing protein [Planctomycetaceae bacterium]|nr:PilZ domain-containing protein [Planctomycetaceae bacterium]